jgi:hypothetical protein
MSTGTILGLLGFAGFAACALTALSGYALMARTKGAWREAAGWDAPLILTSAALALLAAAGGTPAAFLAPLPLIVIAVRDFRLWRGLARRDGWARAAWRFLAGYAGRLRDALWNAGQDLRDLAGAARPKTAGEPEAALDARAAAPASARRAVPTLREDPALGAAPHPADVAESLEASGVAVPPAWQALADSVAGFEPDDDEDLCAHMAGETAGVLTWAEAAMARAENLVAGAGLDPAYGQAQMEFADAIAELASVAAMVDRRYQDLYEGIREAADGRPLPRNRHWFAGGAPADGDGQAA